MLMFVWNDMGLNAIVCVKYYSYSLTVEVEGSLSSL